VISDGLWKREFGADPHILGKALRLDNDEYHVVGVMPRGFRDPGSTSEEQNVELWLGARLCRSSVCASRARFTSASKGHRAPEGKVVCNTSPCPSPVSNSIVNTEFRFVNPTRLNATLEYAELDDVQRQ
jgi:hypothetical protein